MELSGVNGVPVLEVEKCVQSNRNHCSLQVLLLVPTSATRLLPLLINNLPHKLRDRRAQCLYLRGAFSIAEGRAGAALRDDLLAGIIDHLISVDVEIR